MDQSMEPVNFFDIEKMTLENPSMAPSYYAGDNAKEPRESLLGYEVFY